MGEVASYIDEHYIDAHDSRRRKLGPKYRRKILTNGIDTRLKELLLEYAANISVDIMEIMPAIHNRDTNVSINNLNKGLQMQSAQAYIRLHRRAYENSIIELVDTV